MEKAVLEVVGKGGGYVINNRRIIGQLFGKNVGSSLCTSC